MLNKSAKGVLLCSILTPNHILEKPQKLFPIENIHTYIAPNIYMSIQRLLAWLWTNSPPDHMFCVSAKLIRKNPHNLFII
jgi:hypothetical protein